MVGDLSGVGVRARYDEMGAWLAYVASLGSAISRAGKSLAVAVATAYMRKPHGWPDVSEVAQAAGITPRAVRLAYKGVEPDVWRIAYGRAWREGKFVPRIPEPAKSGRNATGGAISGAA